MHACTVSTNLKPLYVVAFGLDKTIELTIVCLQGHSCQALDTYEVTTDASSSSVVTS